MTNQRKINFMFVSTTYRSKRILYDFLFLMALIFQDAGTFQKLPLNLYQLIILALGILIILGEHRIIFNKKLVILFSYIFVVTFLINEFDLDSVKAFLFFCIQMVILYMYVESFRNVKELLNVIYLAAVVLSVYILIQEVAFKLNLPQIYNLSNYGFASNGQYILSDGTLRASSLYAEPAHLSSILSFGFFIGLIDLKDEKRSFPIMFTVLIFISSLFTQSIIVYISMAVYILAYFLFVERSGLFKRLLLLFVIIFILLYLIVMFNQTFTFLKEKFLTIFSVNSMSTDDLSSFAVISNIQIAIEKMKLGYILGTGLDSNRLYYYNLIGNFYSNALMLLNYNDAASLFTRIFSEFGIFGLLVTLIQVFRKLIYSIHLKDFFLLSFVILFIVQGMRNGSYTYILASISMIYLIK